MKFSSYLSLERQWITFLRIWVKDIEELRSQEQKGAGRPLSTSIRGLWQRALVYCPLSTTALKVPPRRYQEVAILNLTRIVKRPSFQFMKSLVHEYKNTEDPVSGGNLTKCEQSFRPSSLSPSLPSKRPPTPQRLLRLAQSAQKRG